MPAKWKVVQSRRKQKKKIKLALLAVAALGALFMAGALVNLTKTLTSPWQLEAQKSYNWDGQFNISVAVKGKSISLINLNSSQKRVTVIAIPDSTYADVPGGFGKWQIRSVYDLGGGSLLERTLTSFLAVPVDGFIQLKEDGEDYVDWIRRSPLNIILSLQNIRSDLTPLELLQFNLKLFQVRYDKINPINLESSLVLDKVALADQTEVLIGDPVRLDSVLASLADETIKTEHKTVAVFNATERPLIAQKAARMITNLGGNVIQTTNASIKSDKTFIWGEESATLQRLRQIFNCCGKLEFLEGISSRAEVNVVLGEDFFLRLGN